MLTALQASARIKSNIELKTATETWISQRVANIAQHYFCGQRLYVMFYLLDVLISALLGLFRSKMDPAEQSRVKGRLALVTGASGG